MFKPPIKYQNIVTLQNQHQRSHQKFANDMINFVKPYEHKELLDEKLIQPDTDILGKSGFSGM